MDNAISREIAKYAINEIVNIARNNIESVNINSNNIINNPINKKIWIGSYCIDINIKQ